MALSLINPMHEISEEEFESELQVWEDHYRQLVELTSRSSDMQNVVRYKLKKWLPVRKNIMKHLGTVVEKIRTFEDINVACKALTTAFHGLAMVYFVGKTLFDDSPPSRDTFDGINAASDFAEKLIKIIEEEFSKSFMDEIKSLLEIEKDPATDLCESLHEMKEITAKIKSHRYMFNNSVISGLYRDYTFWSRQKGQICEREETLSNQVGNIFERVSSICDSACNFSSIFMDALNLGTCLRTPYIVTSSSNQYKATLMTQAGGLLLLDLFKGATLWKEKEEGSLLLQHVEKEYKLLEKETDTFDDLLDKLNKDAYKRHNKELLYTEEQARECKKAIRYLHSFAKSQTRKQRKHVKPMRQH